jgi:cyanate permease
VYALMFGYYNIMLLIGILAGAGFATMAYQNKLPGWKQGLIFLGVLLALAWAMERYSVEPMENSSGGVIVDRWKYERIGTLFQMPSDEPPPDYR